MPPQRTQRSKTPASEDLDPKESYEATQTKIQAVCGFNDRHKLTYFKSDVFKFFGVTRRKGWEMLRGDPFEANKRPEGVRDPRGRPPKLKRDDVAKVEDMLANGDIQTTGLSWRELAELAGVTHVHWHTLRGHIQDMDYLKCLGCDKAWVSKEHGRRREDWCRITLSMRPHWHDWVFVRFADEIHIGLSAQNKLRAIRDHGTRYCADHDERLPPPKDVKRFHCWAWVGYDFISELVFYEVDSLTGIMTQDIYIDKILKPHVLPAVQAEPRLVLEEMGDLGHTGLKTTKFKRENRINCYSHASKSPDLSIIENALSEQNLNRIPPSDDETAIAAIRTAWAMVSKEWVNSLVVSMPDRLTRCLLTGGKMIP